MANHVLIVDDDPDIRSLIASALAWDGVATTTAANGQEGLMQIAADCPQLVLLDLNMPVMTGWEMLARLRALPNGVPVVIMTAGNAVQARMEGARQHVASFLGKPFDLSDLMAVVSAFTSSPASADATAEPRAQPSTLPA
jgi:DNA-binding response OmpR family regulator